MNKTLSTLLAAVSLIQASVGRGAFAQTVKTVAAAPVAVHLVTPGGSMVSLGDVSLTPGVEHNAGEQLRFPHPAFSAAFPARLAPAPGLVQPENQPKTTIDALKAVNGPGPGHADLQADEQRHAARYDGKGDPSGESQEPALVFAPEVKAGLFSQHEAAYFDAAHVSKQRLEAAEREFGMLFDTLLYQLLLARTLRETAGNRKASAEALAHYKVLRPEIQRRLAAGVVSRLKELVFVEPARIPEMKRTIEESKLDHRHFEFLAGVMRAALADQDKVVDAVELHIAAAAQSPAFVASVTARIPRFALFGGSAANPSPGKPVIPEDFKAIFASRLTPEAQLSAIRRALDKREWISPLELAYLLERMPRGVAWGIPAEKGVNSEAKKIEKRGDELGITGTLKTSGFLHMDVALVANMLQMTRATEADEPLLAKATKLVDKILSRSLEMGEDEDLSHRTTLRGIVYEEFRRLRRKA